MAARTVVDPEGRTWRVKRRWLHRSLHWRGPDGVDVADAGSLTDVVPFLDDDLGCLPAIGIVITGVTAVLVAIFFVLPAIVFAVELVVLLLAVGIGVLARVILRRPWTVEARLAGTNQGREWKVVGWRASGELVDTMAERLRTTGRIGDVSWT